MLCCWCVSVLGRGPSDSISKKHRADYNHTCVASSLSTSTSTSCCSCQPLLGSRRPTDRPTTNNLVRQRLGASSVQDSRNSHVEAPIASEARCTAEPIDAAVKPVQVLPQPQVRHTSCAGLQHLPVPGLLSPTCPLAAAVSTLAPNWFKLTGLGDVLRFFASTPTVGSTTSFIGNVFGRLPINFPTSAHGYDVRTGAT